MTKLLYRDRYRIPSARLPHHDYSHPGWYFITICTNIRYPWFGYIKNGIMCVNDAGSLAYQYWQDIPNHYDNVILDAFVVMPDHIHGIIRIINGGNKLRPVETCHGMSLHNTFSKPIANSLSMIVNHYKGAITRQCRRNGHTQFQWQPRYHDRIIRSRRELHNVRRYIIDNPREYKQII